MASSAARPALPTYQTAAATLEGSNGAGVRLVGYTFARTLIIAPWMMIGGMPAKSAFFWSLMASGTMSIFVLLRIFDAKAMASGPLAGASQRRRALPSSRRGR